MSAAGNQVGFWNKTYFGPPSTADSPPDAENVVSGQHKLYHRSGPKIWERLNLNGFNERNKSDSKLQDDLLLRNICVRDNNVKNSVQEVSDAKWEQQLGANLV